MTGAPNLRQRSLEAIRVFSNGGSEGVAANHQHSGGDATDERNWIHGSKEIRLNAGVANDAPAVGLPPNCFHLQRFIITLRRSA